MKRKVFFKLGGRPPVTYHHREYFPVVWEELSSYFRCGFNHTSASLFERGLYVFSTVYMPVEDIYEEGSIVVEVDSPPPYSAFFDTSTLPCEEWGEIGVVPIYLSVVNGDERKLGYYIPTYESLVLSDVSHTKECAEYFLEKVWPSLLKQLEELGFGPLSGEPTWKSVEPEDIKLGADPEFEVLSKNGEFIPARRVIPGGSRDQIGCDGADHTGEWRPTPQNSPEDLVEEMRRLIQETAELLNERGYMFSLKGENVPLGGHIHIGGLPFLSDEDFKILVDALDTVVGKFLFRSNSTTRLNSSYGCLGAWRRQPWGVEYRTPPAVMWANPQIAHIVLKIVSGVVQRLVTSGELEVEVNAEGEATAKTLLQFISKEEMKTLLQFVENWKEEASPRKVYSAWGLPTPGIVITTRDDWDGERESLIRRLLKRVLDVEKAPDLVLYGLHRDRGFVSTIPGGETEMEGNYPKPLWQEGALWIGLPYEFRCQKPELDKVEVLYRDLFTFLNSRSYLKVSPEEALRIALKEESRG